MGIVTGYLSQLVSSGIKLSVGGTAVSSSNPLPVSAPDSGSVSGSVTSAAVLFTTNMTDYESLTLQVTSAGSSCTIVYETSEDQLTWYASPSVPAAGIGTSAPSGSSSSLTMNLFQRRGTYFRARVSTYGSGTVTILGVKSKVSLVTSVEARVSNSAYEGFTASTSIVAIGLEGRTSSKTSVTSGQAVRPISTVDGRQIVRLNSIPENEWQYAAASGGITNTTDAVLVAAAGASIKNYLTGLSLANANATATEVVVKDGSTVIWRMYLAANAPIQSIKFVTPLQSTANAALNVACITTGSQTYINAQGYKAP